MRRLTFAIGALVLAAPGMSQTFGNDPIDRAMVDQAHQITFLDPGILAPNAGFIGEWRLYAGDVGDVSLQIFRPVVGGYEKLGENNVTVSSVGLNTIAVAPSERIAVQAGDILGFRYNQTTFGNRVIELDMGVGGTYQWTVWPDAGDVGIGGVLGTSSLTGAWEGRRYSLNATIVPVPEPFTGLVLAAGLALLRRRR